MKTIAVLKRTFEPFDYSRVKEQAKAFGYSMKDLANKCGYKYNHFKRILEGKFDGTDVAEKLLNLGFNLTESNEVE